MKDILTISKEALESVRLDKNTINGTVGVFLDEEKTLSNKLVDETLLNLNSNDIAPYLATNGGEEFISNIKKWAFKNYLHIVEDHFIINVSASIGGSGAISHVLNLLGKDNDEVLIPNITWQYAPFINKARKRVRSYNLFKNNKFDFYDFKTKLDELAKNQDDVIIVLNDPAHNPTGYTMSKEERLSLFELLNHYKENKIHILYDLAYFDYDEEYINREVFKDLLYLHDNVSIYLTLSGSKSFGLYGTRIGAVVELIKQPSNFIEKVNKSVVGSYSAPVTLGVLMLNNLLNKKYLNHQNDVLNILTKRRNLFLEETKLVNLESYPSKSGFFVLIKSENPVKDYEKLKKNKIFLVPQEGGLRLSLSSLTLNEIKGLAKKIKVSLE